MRWNIHFGLAIFLVRAFAVAAPTVSRDKVQNRPEGNLVSSFTLSNPAVVDTRDEGRHSE